jgi:nucleoside-diphosphate-sugar epimerase
MATLVTGGTGYLGGAFARALSAAGEPVVAVGRSGDGALGAEHALPVPYVHALSAGELLEVMREYGVTSAAHFATHYSPAHDVDDVDDIIDANVRFGSAVAEAAVGAGASMITFGTYWQYAGGVPNATNSLYAATKRALDDVLDYYIEARGLRAQTLVLYDVYGEDDPRGKVLTLLVSAALSGEEIKLSSGKQLINLTHVDDVVAAARHANATLNGESPRVASVRAEEFQSIRELCSTVEAVLAKPVHARWGDLADRPGSMLEPWLIDPVLPGWAPSVSLTAGIERLARARGWRGSTEVV